MSEATPRPIPEVTDDLRPFFEAARESRLVVQRCPDCGTLRFPARPICSQCLGRRSEWIAVSGRGTVYSFNVMHHLYHPGFAGDLPYAVVLVELEEGVRVLSNVVDCPPHELRIGLAVEAVFERVSDEVTLPKFRPRGSR